jgi:hypothetical protein
MSIFSEKGQFRKIQIKKIDYFDRFFPQTISFKIPARLI